MMESKRKLTDPYYASVESAQKKKNITDPALKPLLMFCHLYNPKLNGPDPAKKPNPLPSEIWIQFTDI